MYHFEYVSIRQRKETKKELIKIINLVQGEVRKDFTFRFDFIGSDPLNMVTCDYSSNIGYDFDVNIEPNDVKDCAPKEIKTKLMNAFNKVLREFNYDYCEDSTRVFTIKVKDPQHSSILHSCDFAIVSNNDDGSQKYIRFNKSRNSYSWEYQPKGFYEIEEKIKVIKDNGLWNFVRDLYLVKKNNNTDHNKKSRSLRAETINEIYNLNFKD